MITRVAIAAPIEARVNGLPSSAHPSFHVMGGGVQAPKVRSIEGGRKVNVQNDLLCGLNAR